MDDFNLTDNPVPKFILSKDKPLFPILSCDWPLFSFALPRPQVQSWIVRINLEGKFFFKLR